MYSLEGFRVEFMFTSDLLMSTYAFKSNRFIISNLNDENFVEIFIYQLNFFIYKYILIKM
jgi:hypothetical protein